MSARTRLVGLLVLLGGLASALAALGLLGAARSDGSLGGGGYAIGLFLALALHLPLMSTGVYLLVRGRVEADEPDEGSERGAEGG